MKTRRFALVVPQFPLQPPPPPGEDYFSLPAQMMSEDGFAVEIFALRRPQQSSQEQIGQLVVRRFDSRPRLLRMVAAGRFDIIHAHSHFLPALLTGLVAWHTKTVFTSHSGVLPAIAWKRRVIVSLMNRFDRLIALTPHERDVYTQAGVDRSRIAVVGHPVNVAFFSEPGDASRFRRQWQLPADASLVVFVANIRLFKNPEVVLRAVRRVREQRPEVVLVVAGEDQLAREGCVPLAEQARRLGVSDGLRLTGWLTATELRDCLTAASLLINSSATEQESFSLSTWEACAAARPVCLPRLGTFLSTIGPTALYHDPNDDATLAANILRYLGEPELAATHARANRAKVEQLAQPVSLARLRDVYRSLEKC